MPALRLPGLDQKIAFLRNPASYPGRVGRVTSIETHFAWVFLTPRHAYKLKKPVRHDAIDYRTLAARARGCREEVRLNRRLAPSVYLSIVPLTVTRAGSLSFGRDGRILDWLVKMRRLPAERMLDQVLRRRSLRRDEFEPLVLRLVEFFGRARHVRIRGCYVDRLRRQLTVNRRVLRHGGTNVDQALADVVVAAQRRLLRRGGAEVEARRAHVVEGHGDLRAEHVCLVSPPCVIDCLEFDKTLREFDPVEEIAALALEMERCGRPALAAHFVRRFCEASGDPVDPSIVHFYQAQRALTRAKLSLWHLEDPQFPDPEYWLERADSYLRDAARHARQALLGFDRTMSGRLIAHRAAARGAFLV
jgi:aminoglycoside phosphotransferase family enzyme